MSVLPNMIDFKSINELMKEVLRRAGEGNILRPADDPINLEIGCLDSTQGEWLKIRLADLKSSLEDLEPEQASIVKKAMTTTEGKNMLFMHN